MFHKEPFIFPFHVKAVTMSLCFIAILASYVYFLRPKIENVGRFALGFQQTRVHYTLRSRSHLAFSLKAVD